MPIQQNIKVAVDAIVFGYQNSQLFVLLIQQKFGELKEKWALPGGFVLDNESLRTAVQRELLEEAGIEVNYLEQLYTFGDDLNRDPRGRVISVAYFALVNSGNFELQAGTDAKHAEWFPINEIPELAFDHNHIFELAFSRLQAKLQYQPIGFNLLDEEFSFSDLENLYRTILQHDFDRRNFRKKILSFELLTETGNIRSIGSGRPAKLFRFNLQKYSDLEKNGLAFEIRFA